MSWLRWCSGRDIRSGSTLRFENDFTVFAKNIKVSARRYDAEDSVEFVYARKNPTPDGEKRKKEKKCVAQLRKLRSRHYGSVLRVDSAFVGVRSVQFMLHSRWRRKNSQLSFCLPNVNERVVGEAKRTGRTILVLNDQRRVAVFSEKEKKNACNVNKIDRWTCSDLFSTSTRIFHKCSQAPIFSGKFLVSTCSLD